MVIRQRIKSMDKDKMEHFDLFTEQVDLSEKGNSTTICITTNMKWNIKQ